MLIDFGNDGKGGGGGVGPGSVLFGKIGYDDDTPIVKDTNKDIEYSFTKYEEWDQSLSSASRLYEKDDKLVYAPNIGTANVTDMSHMYYECGNLVSVPKLFTNKVTNMEYMFSYCERLRYVPDLNTENVTNMRGMFNSIMLKSIPSLNTQNVTNMSYMFNIKKIFGEKHTYVCPQFNTQNAKDMSDMFYRCPGLIEIPSFDTKKCENMNNMFGSCEDLTTIGEYDCSSIKTAINAPSIKENYEQSRLTTVGGFPNLKVSLELTGPSFKPMNALTKESLMNIINKVAPADPAIEAQPKLTFNSKPYSLLTPEDIKIATDKGWTVADKGF